MEEKEKKKSNKTSKTNKEKQVKKEPIFGSFFVCLSSVITV